MSLWTESGDPELAKLHQRVKQLDNQLANSTQLNATLKEQLAEAVATHKEDVHRLQQLSTQANTAEEALRKKGEELKQSQVQKSNAQQACIALEKQLKEEQQETKRLEYQLESSSTRANASAPAQSRVLIEEKAALERRVKELSADLKKSEAALVQEKEANTARPSPQGTASSSRTSISPADQANSQRNRFGFGAPAKGRTSLLPEPSATPARPSSSLGTHSNIPGPAKSRRSSSFSGIPTTSTVATSSAPRIAQLERELGESHARVEGAEKDFLGVKTKLAGKERELLNVENRMLALERSKSDEIEALKNKLEDAFDTVAEKKQEVAAVKETLRAELDKALREGREEKTSLLAKVERMRVELEKREADLDRSEAGREELEQMLSQAKENDKVARSKSSKGLEEAQAIKGDLEREVARLKTELKEAAGGSAARERSEEELASVREELDTVRSRTTKAIDDLRTQKEAAEQALEVARSEAKAATREPVHDEDKAQLEAEIEDVKQQLAAAEDHIQALESRDVVSVEVARADVDQVEQQRLALEKELREATDDRRQLEEVKETLIKQVEALEQAEIESSGREAALQQKAASDQDVISELQGNLATLRAETSTSPAEHEALTAELASVQALLAVKETEMGALTSRLASVEEAHSSAIATSAQALKAANFGKQELDNEVADLQKERDDLVASLQTLESQLETVMVQHAEELAASAAAVEQAESTRVQLEATITSLESSIATIQEERKSATVSLTEVSATLASLRAEKDEADRLVLDSTTPARTFDDAHVQDLEERLVAAEEHAADLTKQLAEMEEFETLRADDRQLLEIKVEALEQTITELQDDLEMLDGSSREEIGKAQESLEVERRRVEEAEARTAQVEQDVAEREEELVSLTDRNEQLASTIVDLELSVGRLAALEADLVAAHTELDALRTSSEEGSMIAMQESGELHRRIAEQETTIEDLGDQVASIEALRLTLLHEQTKAGSLAQDLARVQEEAIAAKDASADRLASLTSRAEQAEEDVHCLRSKLDEATAKLVDSGDLLSQSQADLQHLATAAAVAAPASPISPSHTTSFPQVADASILVSRLREERDDLRSRLDFARTEASYRVQALQERLQETEEAKASEVARVRVELAEMGAELGAEKEGKMVVEREGRELQADLEASRLALATASDERAIAGEVVEQSRLALAEAENRVAELQEALDAVQDRMEDDSVTPTPEMVALCEALQKQVGELQARVMRRTETIGRHEQTIAQLENRLATLDDEDDDADTAEIPTVSSEAAQISVLKAQLEEEERMRDDLEEQLEGVVQHLDEAKDQLAASEKRAEELEREVQATLDAEAGLEDELHEARDTLEEVQGAHEALQADFDSLTAQHEELAGDHDDLSAHVDELQSVHAEVLDRVRSLEDDLATAEQRLAEAVGETESRRASFEALRPSLSIMETRLEDAIAEKHALEQQIGEKENVVEELRSRVAGLEEDKAKLSQEVEDASQHALSSAVDLERIETLQGELQLLRESLADAEEKLVEAQASRDALEESHATEMHAVSQELETLAVEHDKNIEELARGQGELDAASSSLAELEARRLESQQALDLAQHNLADLTARSSSAEADLIEARAAAESSSSALVVVQQQLDEQIAPTRHHEEEVAAVQQRLDSTSAELVAAHNESRERITQLEEDLDATRSELADAMQAMEASEQAARMEIDDATQRLEQLSAEKAEVTSALSQAQEDLAAAQVGAEDSSRSQAKLELLETQLHDAQREIEGLGELVQVEREAVRSQKEVVGKVESARDAAMRENKTLRALVRSTEAEGEALKGENARLDKVAAALEQDNLALDDRLRNIEETSQAHLTELLDTLQLAEERKAEVERQVVVLEQQIQELEASLAAAPSATQQDTAELEEQIKELSQQLEAKSIENEDTDEKYMEVLKSQKRHLSQIERLKAKISSLQRDLTNAKAAAAAAPPAGAASAPASAAPASLAVTEPTSVGKKRRAPTEFDPLPTGTPRAVVAVPTRTPSSAPAVKEKENSAPTPVSRPRSDSLKRKPAPSADGVVALKPAAASPPAREVLKVVEANGAVPAAPVETVKPLSKVEELRARLAAQRAGRSV